MLAMAAVVALSSCDNEGTNPVLEDETVAAAVAASVIDTTAFGNSDMSAWSEINKEDLPQSVLDYLAENYPEDEVRHAWVDENGGYVVLLRGRTAVRFDNSGAFIEAVENAGRRRKGRDNDRPALTEIDLADLPASITDYISTHYEDYTIAKAGTDDEGNYHVKLENGPILIFDADGNFVEARERRNDGDRKRDRRRGNGDQEHADDRWTAIDIANLPTAVTDYVANNYPDATILRAGTDAEGNFGVILDNGIALIFDADGVFLKRRRYHQHDGECDRAGEGDGEGDGDGE